MTNQTTVNKEKFILELLQQKDNRGLILLYKHYSNALYYIIIRIVKKEEVAQEVLQDVFVKIWTQINTYDTRKSKLFTWMARVAKNTAIDYTRSKSFQYQRRTDYVDGFNDNNQSSFKTSTSIRDYGLEKVVQQLSPKHYQIINCLYFKDFTQNETSKVLGIPLGTVKSRARLAMKNLRHLLKNEPFENAGKIINFIQKEEQKIKKAKAS